MTSALHVAIALVPVLLFLGGLQLMDSFKLVRMKAVLTAIAAGGLAALLCILLHAWLAPATGLELTAFSRYVAPITEEGVKAAFIVFLIARRRVGFLVDAAVQGFAVGAGFAVVENIEYLRTFADAPVMLWLVRGLGTAVLHGATMAIFAMVSRTLADRRPDRLLLVFWPGWLAAVIIHSGFNHVPLPPFAMTMAQLVVLPLLVLSVFQRSEQETREWVGAGLDLDVELLQLVESDTFEFTRFGSYLKELRAHFPGPDRRGHVLPASAGTGAVGSGEGDADGARSRARHAGRRRPHRMPRRAPVSAGWHRPHGHAGAQAAAGHQPPRSVAQVPAGAGGSSGPPHGRRAQAAALAVDGTIGSPFTVHR